MTRDPRDYWSFVEKIQDATDYVQEVLAENENLRRRMAGLEREKQDLAEKLGTLRRLLHRERPEDPQLRDQLGRDAAGPPAPPAPQPARLAPAVPTRVTPATPAACPQPARSVTPALQAV